MSGYVREPVRPEAARTDGGEGRTERRGDESGNLRYASTTTMERTGGGAGASGSPGRSLGQQQQDSISTSQKMMSATWGSILTSVLVTPLDVVRIRLQSQTPVIRASSNNINPANAFKELPPNLGVTACCREVFWVGDNAQFCMVGQNGPGSGTLGSISADCMVEETQRRHITSTVDGLRKIARHEGVLSLWRGLSPTLLMAIPANVIYFTGYDWLRYDRHSPIYKFMGDNYAPLIAGSTARIAAASVISPIEMFRTRLQATSGRGTDHFKATLRGLHQLTQTQGYSALWRGLTLTMWRDVPFSGFYWWGYEAVKNVLTDMRAKSAAANNTLALGEMRFADGHNHNHNHHQQLHSRQASQSHQTNAMTFLDSFTAGAVSGALAAFVTTPFDVGKTRQQVFRHHGSEPTTTSPSSSDHPSSRVNNNTSASFTSSSFSKLTSSSPSYPTTNNPSPPSSTAKPILHPEQLSIPRFLLHIFQHEGLAGLFRGWAARCLKVAPACAIMISSYEIGKKMAGKVNERRDHKDAEFGDGV